MKDLLALNNIINKIRKKKNLSALNKLERHLRLVEDLGLDSLDLAELTVHLEEGFGIDVFEDGIVHTVDDILDKICIKSK